MKQLAQNYRSGELSVLDVPVPACQSGGVLVRSLYSLISTGTELMKVREAKMSLIGKARSRPDQVRKVLDGVSQNGLLATYTKAMTRLDSYTPLGYSLSGIVCEVGHGSSEFEVGQLVACAGNEHALHGEMNWVPTNLCVPVPDGVDPRLAAFATVGAVAMHGVRRAEVQLGDTACVVGLGLVGQITVQLLIAAGVRVVGFDVVEERCRLAEASGAVACDVPEESGMDRIERTIGELSRGVGVDHVFLVAGGQSNGPVETAARLARDRARVIDVGKLRLDLPWNAFYEKELDVRFSRSYGPGRYDDNYELNGIDYPIGYVRWTERRNLQCFVDMLAEKQLPIESLISGVFPLDDAPEVYEQIRNDELHGVGFLFGYPDADLTASAASWNTVASDALPKTRTSSRRSTLRVGFIGAGNYATSMLLPHLKASKDVELARVVTATSLSAANARRRFGFTDMSTDVDDVLADDTIDAVFIVTRHESHASLVCKSLASGKATFVEKPLALDEEQLFQVIDIVKSSGNDRLMVGFNRRFAPLLQDVRERFGNETAGSVVHYTVNAGTLATDSWYQNAEIAGSRFVGEGGHFVDTIGWWLSASPLRVSAMSARDSNDVHAVFAYDDGSIASIDYITNGNARFPKESIEVSANGRTARFENFRRASVWSGTQRVRLKARGRLDKGQVSQVHAFIEAVKLGKAMPISFSSLVTTTAATLAVDQSLALGRPISL